MNLNAKIKLNGDVEKILESGIMFLTVTEDKIELNAAEQMIINHHDNFTLGEIKTILREFFQLDNENVDFILEEFIFKLTDKGFAELVGVEDKKIDINNKDIVRKPDIEFIEDEDGTGVLRNFKLGQLLFVNGTAIRIWNFIEKPRSFDDICDYLLSIYDVESCTVKKEIKEFLAVILEKEFIELRLQVNRS